MRKIVKPTSGKSNKAASAAKPATAAAKPVAAVPTVAKAPAHITRTAATAGRQATNFNGVSDRDSAYHAFYRTLGATFTVADIHRVAGEKHGGRCPGYAGSAKPHDAGVLVRLVKAGFYAMHDSGNRYTITEAGKAKRG